MFPVPLAGLLQEEIPRRLFEGGHGGLRHGSPTDDPIHEHLSALTHCLRGKMNTSSPFLNFGKSQTIGKRPPFFNLSFFRHQLIVLGPVRWSQVEPKTHRMPCVKCLVSFLLQANH